MRVQGKRRGFAREISTCNSGNKLVAIQVPVFPLLIQLSGSALGNHWHVDQVLGAPVPL